MGTFQLHGLGSLVYNTPERQINQVEEIGLRVVSVDEFLSHLQRYTSLFANSVATNEGEWIVKGFIDIYKRIYTISVDTKIISIVLELLLFPVFVEFADKYDCYIQLSSHQNFYPDLTIIHRPTLTKFAVDVKSTYRTSRNDVNGLTLGAFTGYFRNRDSTKNTTYPYREYAAHLVLGIIYSRNLDAADERRQFSLDELTEIPAVVRDFTFFVQPKYRIAASKPGSGNTKNIGSVTKIDQLISGAGPFAQLGEEVYDDYWMYYLTADMARSLEVVRPYVDLRSYFDYKQRGSQVLQKFQTEIAHWSEAVEAENDGEVE